MADRILNVLDGKITEEMNENQKSFQIFQTITKLSISIFEENGM
jgi:hypothetical protein